jgi:hypothetical protein
MDVVPKGCPPDVYNLWDGYDIDKRKNKKEHFCSSGSSGKTRGYTTSNLITTEGLMTWSSEVFRISSSHFLI